jgi:hypothetical protein
MPTTATAIQRMRPAAMGALLIAAAAVNAATAIAAVDYEARSSRSGTEAHRFADGNLVDVSIRVDDRATPLYFKPGRFDRHYFQAFKGRNYSLVVRNNTGRRVGVLIAVDGLNVVNGQESRLSHNESMYVLDPWEESTIQGWRTSLHEVRKFVFVDEERSYAERTGQANEDMGWIRVLAFRENAPVAIWDRLKYKDNERGWNDDSPRSERGREGMEKSAPATPPPSAAPESRTRDMAPRAQAENLHGDESGNPGTGWGGRENDPVRRTEFHAERQATDQIVMRYEYEGGLRALGIFPRRMRTWEREEGQFGFAQPPRR